MNKQKRIITLIVGVLVLCMAGTTFAASFTASNASELEDAFNTATDAENTVTLTADIEDSYAYLQTEAGKKFTIETDGYRTGDLWIVGEGTVEINGDVTGTGFASYALQARGEGLNVTVNGDVTGADGVNDYGQSAVYATIGATVNVDGDVKGGVRPDFTMPAATAWKQQPARR